MSGVLEEYTSGTLEGERLQRLTHLLDTNPMVVNALSEHKKKNRIRESVDGFPLSDGLKQKLFENIRQIDKDQAARFANADLINPHSDFSFWHQKLNAHHPEGNYENVYLVPIRNEGKVNQFVAWVKEMVEPEIHEDMIESFMILEGSCTCKLNDKVFNLSAGDFIEIPLFITHSLKVTSPSPVKAVLQRIYL